MQTTVKEELLELMQLPSLRPEKARVLYLQGIKGIDQVLQAKIDDIVNIFDKVESYQSHRKQNEEDLELKYRYLYTLAHKVMAEARLHRLNNPIDEDGSAPKEFKLGKKVQSDYLLDSDQEQDESDPTLNGDPRKKILQDLGLDPRKVSLDDLTIADLDNVLENLSDFSGIASEEIEVSEDELEESVEDAAIDQAPAQEQDDAEEDNFGLSCLSDFPPQDEDASNIHENPEAASDLDISAIHDSALQHLLDSEAPVIPPSVPAEQNRNALGHHEI